MPEENINEENAKILWKKVLGELQTELSPTTFGTVIKSIQAENLTDTSITLNCPNQYIHTQVSKKYLTLISESLTKLNKSPLNINLQIKLVATKQESKELGPLFKHESRDMEAETRKSGLIPSYTFDNYLMGKNNNLAYAIALAVAENPGKTYNPFFIYSGVGLGKTHLMQAIGNQVLAEKPNLKVLYVTGENFTNELIDLIQSGKRGKYALNEFRDKYRKADVLLIDDIQFIAGKDSTQEEFFHTFDALFRSQKQIVITSDRPPKDFTNLEARITSRFGSGIIADIQSPDLEMRTAILRYRRDKSKDEITNEVINFIAEKVQNNIRELEGAYLTVLTEIKTLGKPCTVETAREALKKSVKETITKPVNVNQIIGAVCKYYSVRMTDLKGKQRTKDLVTPRHVAMYLMKEITGTPYETIGEVLGGRDHTTIMHGVGKVENELKEVEKVRQDVFNVKQLLAQA